MVYMTHTTTMSVLYIYVIHILCTRYIVPKSYVANTRSKLLTHRVDSLKIKLKLLRLY